MNNTIMKKLIAKITAAILLLSLTATLALASDSVKSSTLHLTKTEGTVAVKNKNDKEISTIAGMRLYSGYSLSTARESYAFIGLDDSKAVKLDKNSAAEARASGSKIELLLTAGNMFFNIETPVADGAELNIRTSTTVTGIRGTSGVVSKLDELTTVIYLFTGHVTIMVDDPFTEEVTVTDVYAGQKLTSTEVTDTGGDEYIDVKVEEFEEEEVKPFAADEIRKSETLQEEITSQTELSVPKIIGDVDERLAAEYAADIKQEAEIEVELAKLENNSGNDNIDPVFIDNSSGNASSESSSGGGGGGTSPSATNPPADNPIITSAIKDTNFQKVIREIIGKPTGDITASDVADIAKLDVSGRDIKDLAGIENFVSLTQLYCYGNELETLDLSHNTELKTLYCFDSQLKSLDVSKNTELESLRCYKSQIVSLNVSNNASLKELDCSYGQLESLDVSGNTALTRLYCYSNNIKVLDVSKNTALIELYCHRNNLKTLDVSKNLALQYLDCSNNDMTSINDVIGWQNVASITFSPQK